MRTTEAVIRCPAIWDEIRSLDKTLCCAMTNYMLKDRQKKSEFDGFLDCIIIESLHNPIADA